MVDVNTLLSERLKKSQQGSGSKMAALAKQSANGNLTSFGGVFSVTELSEQEAAFLESLLQTYAGNEQDVAGDLRNLISLTAEVKAINNQAAILHGERIKKAHAILTSYRDGAFSAWLLATYGNRQTPYNFMLYYEFYEALPKTLRSRLESMPRQAIYTLASRDASFDKKTAIVANYKGETKGELLRLIREIFPLSEKDKRKSDAGEMAIQTLTRLYDTLNAKNARLTKKQALSIEQLLNTIQQRVQSLKT